MSGERDDTGMQGYRVLIESSTPYASPPRSFLPVFLVAPLLGATGLLALVVGIGATVSDLAGPDEKSTWVIVGLVVAVLGAAMIACAAYLTLRAVRRSRRPGQPERKPAAGD